MLGLAFLRQARLSVQGEHPMGHTPAATAGEYVKQPAHSVETNPGLVIPGGKLWWETSCSGRWDALLLSLLQQSLALPHLLIITKRLCW